MLNLIVYCVHKQPQATTTDKKAIITFLWLQHLMKCLCNDNPPQPWIWNRLQNQTLHNFQQHHVVKANPEVLLSMYPGLPGINGEHSPQKTWESVYVWKWSVKSTRIKSIYFRIIERCTHLPVEIPSTPKKRIIAVYTKAKMLSCGYQLGLAS